MDKMKIWCVFWAFCLLGACYDDKGNYDYTGKLAIKVTGIEEEYVRVVLDTIKFRPVITPVDREYECFWGVVPDGGYQFQFDTISKIKDLDYGVNLKPGTYKLRFCARDMKTGVFTLQEYRLTVVTDMSIGWWVLKEEGGKTDLDVFTPTRSLESVLKMKNGKALDGKPENMAYVDDWLYFDEKDNTSVETKVVFVASDQDVVAVDFFSGSIMRSFDDLFYNVPVVKRPQNIFLGSNGLFLVNDNRLHVILLAGNGRTGFFGDAQLGNDVVISNYKTSSSRRTPLLFDEKSGSFFTTTYTSLSLISFLNEPWASSDADRSPVNNLNAELLYVGAKMDDYSLTDAYALLKYKQEDKFGLLKLVARYTSPYRNPVESTRLLDNSLGVLSADFRAMAKDYDLMYFSKGNEVWAFDVETLREEKLNVVIPAGERITYMEYLRFTPSADKSLWFNSVIIGTSRGGNYTLYRHDVIAGKLQPGVKIGAGTGEVKRACYLYMGSRVDDTELL